MNKRRHARTVLTWIVGVSVAVALAIGIYVGHMHPIGLGLTVGFLYLFALGHPADRNPVSRETAVMSRD